MRCGSRRFRQRRGNFRSIFKYRAVTSPGHHNMDRIAGVLNFVVLFEATPQIVDAIPHRTVFKRRIIGGTAESFNRNGTFVQGVAATGDFALTNEAEQSPKLICTMERTTGKHSFQRLAFMRFPNRRKDCFHRHPNV